MSKIESITAAMDVLDDEALSLLARHALTLLQLRARTGDGYAVRLLGQILERRLCDRHDCPERMRSDQKATKSA